MSKRKQRALREAKSRREGGGFCALPFAVLHSPQFANLSIYALKYLFDLLSQYRLTNNGDLMASWEFMRGRGWKSRGSLSRARLELLRKGFIKVTRQGGRNVPTLYAVTFYAIDFCGGKLDVQPTRSPSSEWREGGMEGPIIGPLVRRKEMPNTPGVLIPEGTAPQECQSNDPH